MIDSSTLSKTHIQEKGIVFYKEELLVLGINAHILSRREPHSLANVLRFEDIA
jgi:hypothetical protein